MYIQFQLQRLFYFINVRFPSWVFSKAFTRVKYLKCEKTKTKKNSWTYVNKNIKNKIKKNSVKDRTRALKKRSDTLSTPLQLFCSIRVWNIGADREMQKHLSTRLCI